MKDKKSNKFILVLSIILMLLSFILIISGVLIQNKIININIQKTEIKTEETNETVLLEEELETNDKTALELYKKVLGEDSINKHNYKPEYLDSFYYKITNDVLVSDFNNDDLLKIMWFNLKDNDSNTKIENGFVTSVDDFKKVYKDIFGESLEYSKDTTSTSADTCLKVNYNTSNDNYEFYNNCTSIYKIIIYPEIIKIVKSDKELRIYQQVGFISDDVLYSDIDLRNKIDDNFKEDNFSQYRTSLDTYIYTFKKSENNNYYFYKISKE